jgi:hypothetical protein
MKNAQLIIGTLLILNFNQVLSQEDVSKYFEDRGISLASRLIKIGYDPLNGELPIIFEHKITKHISLEWGTGLISIKRQNKRYSENPLPDLSKSGFGYTAWVNMRVYLKGYYERSYIGLQPKLSIMNGKSYGDIVFFNYGYQRPIKNTWIIDFNIGIGIRVFKYSTVIGSIEYKENDSRFFIPIQFKTGYAF